MDSLRKMAQFRIGGNETKQYKAWELLPEEKVFLKSDVNKLLAENDAEIAELKQKLEDVNELIKTARQMLEDAKASHYADSVDAGMRERRLRRALYKACANWAKAKDACDPTGFTKDLVFTGYKWYIMERKCLNKAKEYK